MHPVTRLCCAAFISGMFITPAHADDGVPLIETDRLMVTSIYGQYAMGDLPELTLISEGDGITIFSLDNLAGDLRAPDNGTHIDRGVSVGFEPQPGYTITGGRYSATLVGSFSTAQAPAGATDVVPASARNYAGSYLDTYLASDLTGPIRDVNGSVQFSLYIDNLDPGGHFGPGLYTAVIASATPGSYWLNGSRYTLDASASMRVENPVFIIYTQPLPIPEPQAWMMLLLGLAPLPLLLRRTGTLGPR